MNQSIFLGSLELEKVESVVEGDFNMTFTSTTGNHFCLEYDSYYKD